MKEYRNKKWLYFHYIELKQSTKEIGDICNCRDFIIGRWLKRFNILVRSKSEATKLAMNKPEIKKKFLEANRAFHKNPEYRKKMSENRKGEKNPNWKGDNVSISALHSWIKDHKPKPNFCEICNKKTDKLDCANISGEYKRDINDFQWICRKCHMKNDGRLEKVILRNINVLPYSDEIREKHRKNALLKKRDTKGRFID